MKDGEPMQSRNKRQKTRQFTRKAAAVRLRTQFQQIRANEIANDMHDYSKGQNQHGGSK
jgi:hypothetical protein